MRFKDIFGAAVLAALFLVVPAALCAGSKILMVHYMPWFQAKPYGNAWGWHWTMGSENINPDIVTTNGNREIASWYYPLVGPYDSADPAVLEYHVLLMKLAGIDGVMVDWDGNDNFYDFQENNERMAALFHYTRKAGLKFSVICEPWTIRAEIGKNFITAGDAILHEQQQMLYLERNYFADPSYLRLNGRPVLLDFGNAYFTTGGDWTNVFSALNATNQPAFFTEDDRHAPAAMGVFDWPPMFKSDAHGILSDGAMQSYLANFDEKAAAWPVYISSAWPRFHDYYAQAGNQASNGYLDDQNGNTFRETLARAMTNAASIVQIVTWNDFGEGTVVEPTKEYGYRDLGIIQDFRRQYLDANFPCHTNDLAMALRLYNLRRQYAGNSAVSVKLDGIFTNIVAGKLTVANTQLTALEASAAKEVRQ